MKKQKFDADLLDDYDIERIAGKIEKTGRIALAVHREVADQVRPLQDKIEKLVEQKVKRAQIEGSSNEAYIKLLKYILEELTNANQS